MDLDTDEIQRFTVWLRKMGVDSDTTKGVENIQVPSTPDLKSKPFEELSENEARREVQSRQDRIMNMDKAIANCGTIVEKFQAQLDGAVNAQNEVIAKRADLVKELEEIQRLCIPRPVASQLHMYEDVLTKVQGMVETGLADETKRRELYDLIFSINIKAAPTVTVDESSPNDNANDHSGQSEQHERSSDELLSGATYGPMSGKGSKSVAGTQPYNKADSAGGAGGSD